MQSLRSSYVTTSAAVHSLSPVLIYAASPSAFLSVTNGNTKYINCHIKERQNMFDKFSLNKAQSLFPEQFVYHV